MCHASRNVPARWRLLSGVKLVAVITGLRLISAGLPVEQVRLPALRIEGLPATAHTQGLEIVGGSFYVTARRDDVRPRRALLLRTTPARTNWDAWDISPTGDAGETTALDHPGGMQSDGKRLWIPVAESRRHGRSLIRVFPVTGLTVGRRLEPELEFFVNDHIGAIAVSAGQKRVLGASWDTETVYVWDFSGRLQRTLSDVELRARGLGAVNGPGGRAGLAVQDWKLVGRDLYASGLFRGLGEASAHPASRWMPLTSFLEPGFQRRSITLPLQPPFDVDGRAMKESQSDGAAPHSGPRNVELGHEAMAVAKGWVYFLPEDLGPSNRVFRVALKALQKGD